MEKTFFGTDKNKNEIYCYTLTTKDGASISVLNYGATVQSLKVKNKNGELVDVVLGFDNLQGYEEEKDRPFFGAVMGRTANRIKDGKFFVDATEYTLCQNNHGNCLHGGKDGFDKKFFDLTDAEDNYMTFSYFSENGEEGYPGSMNVSVKYTFTGNLWVVEYMAQTSEKCPVALTNHTYFNLDGKGDITKHSLQLNSQFFMEVDDAGLANGMVLQTKNTPFDFTTPAVLKSPIEKIKSQRPTIKGIDHYFFCDNAKTEYRKFATLSSSDGSLNMEVFTDQIGAQIYTGNFLVPMQGKYGSIGLNAGICIETHCPPSSMQFSHLPTMILKSNEQYYHKTGFRFF